MKKKDIVLIILLLLLDLGSKSLMVEILKDHSPIIFIPHFFQLNLTYNTGAAWGFFSGKQTLFIIVTIIALVVMFYLLITLKSKNKLYRFSFLLIISGTLGNFYDRLFLGKVRDFLDFFIFGYDFPIFNIADSFLTIGFIILAYFIFTQKEGNNE